MGKRRPHYDLEAFKGVCGNRETIAISRTALDGAMQPGLGANEIAAAIRSMDLRMFVKSMACYTDQRIFQDVCHVPFPNGSVAYAEFREDLVTAFFDPDLQGPPR